MVAVPSPLFTKLRPFGSLPFSVITGTGTPVVFTVKEKGVPATTLALSALVMVAAGLVTALN
jgi:hypothetical protein